MELNHILALLLAPRGEGNPEPSPNQTISGQRSTTGRATERPNHLLHGCKGCSESSGSDTLPSLEFLARALQGPTD